MPVLTIRKEGLLFVGVMNIGERKVHMAVWLIDVNENFINSA